MEHSYDPNCYCTDCCEHEDRLTARVAAEESKEREARRAYREAELRAYHEMLQLQTR